MQNDKKINISTGQSRKATNWPVQTLLWSEFVAKLSVPVRTSEAFDVYLSWPKSRQDDVKDVGGFVGGTIGGNGRRKAGNILDRSLITLDADSIQPGGAQDIINRAASLGCAYAIYSTRKHESAKPRLRIVFPLDRAVSSDEYEAAARKLASLMGVMEVFDPTTFEVTRLMYWPSASADGEYIFTYEDKPWVSVGGLLAMYRDWHDVSEWPEVPGAAKMRARSANKQGDPEDKKGVVGAFCRTYDIPAAIDTFLSAEYVHCDAEPGRYTYSGGSTTGGAVLYDDGKFLYSHHATDPCSGTLVNAFDMVRLHRFSDSDDAALPGTPTVQLPSYKAMLEYAVEDPAVTGVLNKERYDAAAQDFAPAGIPAGEETDTNWMGRLSMTATGGYHKTIDNILIILNCDPVLKGKIAHDDFANRPVITGDVPWRGEGAQGRSTWTDTDDAGLRHYIEKRYGLSGKERVLDAFALCAQANSFHRVKSYLDGLVWDGTPRLDTILTDYLGAVDSIYTRAVARKSLCAAIARVYKPGTKFDTAPVLVGAQGIGKTTFLAKLGGAYHIEVEMSFKGKETAELIQGYWIVEMGELKGFSRAEMADVRQFMSRTEDVYREPYGRRTKAFPRQCIFFGTTNDYGFLRDHTGNRRFLPVDVGVVNAEKNIFSDLDQEVDQVWAEAKARWQVGEPLHLTGDAAAEAVAQQEEHKEINPREGMICEFVERLIPEDWDKRDLQARRLWWTCEFGAEKEKTTAREKICAAEVWCECFNGDPKMMKRAEAIEINAILGAMNGWKRAEYPIKFGAGYGSQRGYRRESSLLTELLHSTDFNVVDGMQQRAETP